MKTPDEIKKGLEHCINGTSCRGCPYCEECAIASDCNPMHKDLQEYVQQLEEFADKKIVELFRNAEQLEAERDAAVKDMIIAAVDACDVCKHNDLIIDEAPCQSCTHIFKGRESKFAWRGVQKEE